ncbi:TetR/AcrR family transcriptional regulator [Brevibacterium sp. NPDC056947]|uniref:TetR/AcrR family transcriptional regulator n=1 Tax=Brevibacterium sp. NPDC056947 TaxID=3345974 RepID=UPI003626D5A3
MAITDSPAHVDSGEDSVAPKEGMSPREGATPQEGAAPKEGLRERKKRERQRALRRAAIELTLEKGFSTITIEDICERCGVSRRTFFNYFASKEEALLGRADTVFDDEDEPAIAVFEAGGPTGRLLEDLERLLAGMVRTRLSHREERHQYHQILKQEPALMQAQMSRMGENERLFREMIQRRLDRVGAAEGSGCGQNPGAVGRCTVDDGPPVSPKAEVLAALAMMAIKATFVRLRRVEGDPAPIIHDLFDELRTIFDDG